MKCSYCERGKNLLTKDHIIPKAKGGTDDKNNIELVCFRCNHAKGQLYPMDFIASVELTLKIGHKSEYSIKELNNIVNNLLAIITVRNISRTRDPDYELKPLRKKRIKQK